MIATGIGHQCHPSRSNPRATTGPSGPGDDPAYAQQRDYHPGDEVPVVLDGAEVGRIRVSDLMV